MSEKKLTQDQEARIEAIKQEWMAETKKIPESPNAGKVLDGGGGSYRELEIKYMKKIKEIASE